MAYFGTARAYMFIPTGSAGQSGCGGNGGSGGGNLRYSFTSTTVTPRFYGGCVGVDLTEDRPSIVETLVVKSMTSKFIDSFKSGMKRIKSSIVKKLVEHESKK